MEAILDITAFSGFTIRLARAIVLGFVVGFERQWTKHQAGILTNVIVCVGAYAYTAFSCITLGNNNDTTRVAAGVVSGIGFLGAGVIFVHRGGVVGLTDGKGDLVRLYDWLAQRKITVREIDLKRQEGSSVKIVLYIAMPRHFDKADFLRLQEDIPGVQSVEI